jgi:ADP-ribosyl-[dinitrogen reductase] hydrolase
VIDTVNQGGDADTTGAIAGALAGAYYGEESIPARWRKKLERKLLAEIVELSQTMIRHSPTLTGNMRGEGD